MRDQVAVKSGTIDFLAKFTDSEQFEKTFKEGMSLVEETANYLDGEGRIDARVLDRTGAIAYATESMRLTKWPHGSSCNAPSRHVKCQSKKR
jgi:regulator of CtrA degradation